MRVSPHQVMDAWANGTGKQPESVVLLVVGAVAAEAVVVTLHVADLVSRHRVPHGARA